MTEAEARAAAERFVLAAPDLGDLTFHAERFVSAARERGGVIILSARFFPAMLIDGEEFGAYWMIDFASQAGNGGRADVEPAGDRDSELIVSVEDDTGRAEIFYLL